jgi:hypothetical protein
MIYVNYNIHFGNTFDNILIYEHYTNLFSSQEASIKKVKVNMQRNINACSKKANTWMTLAEIKSLLLIIF